MRCLVSMMCGVEGINMSPMYMEILARVRMDEDREDKWAECNNMVFCSKDNKEMVYTPEILSWAEHTIHMY